MSTRTPRARKNEASTTPAVDPHAIDPAEQFAAAAAAGQPARTVEEIVGEMATQGDHAKPFLAGTVALYLGQDGSIHMVLLVEETQVPEVPLGEHRTKIGPMIMRTLLALIQGNGRIGGILGALRGR